MSPRARSRVEPGQPGEDYRDQHDAPSRGAAAFEVEGAGRARCAPGRTTLDALWDKADRYRRLGLEVVRSQDERDHKAREHAELLDAVVRGDSQGATEVMRQHIEASLGAAALTRLGSEGTSATVTDASERF